MSSTGKEIYRRFLSLCRKWPVEPSKTGRDYGEKFREQLRARFPHGDLGEVKNIEETERYIEALERLANNSYFNENPLKRSSATGLEAWACKDIMSNKNLEMIQAHTEQSMIKRLKETLSMRFSHKDPSTSEKVHDK